MKRNVLFMTLCMMILVVLQGCGEQASISAVTPENSVQVVLGVEPLMGKEPLTEEQVSATVAIIKGRLKEIGIPEATVQSEGTERIMVGLPAIADLEEATKVITESGLLELIDAGNSPLPKGEFVTTELGGLTPAQLESTAQPASAGKLYKVVVSSEDIDMSQVKADTRDGMPVVNFGLKGDGPSKMREFTSNNMHTYMPVVLNKRVINSPQIKGVVSDQVLITGLTLTETRRLAAQLKSGPLPVTLRLIETRQPATPSSK
jgi:preprotein translocase subunit SecD